MRTTNGQRGVRRVRTTNGGNMRTIRRCCVAVVVGLVTSLCALPLAAQAVPIAAADIGGVVTGPSGPEAASG